MTLGYVPIPLTPVTTGRDIITDLERVNWAPVIQFINETPVYSKPKKRAKKPSMRRARKPSKPRGAPRILVADVMAQHGDEIKRRYLAGELVQGIAEDYGIRKGSLIRDALGAAGVPLRDDSGRHPHPISRGRIDLDRARVEELRARGWSLDRIADELGVKVGVVKKRRQEWARADAAKAGNGEGVA